MSKEEKDRQEQTAAGATAGNGQAEPSSEQAALVARAEAAEKKGEEYLDLALRTRAEFENYQKRFARDLAEERRFAQRPLAGDLLPALDNLERATAAAQEAGEKGPLIQGVELALSQFRDILRRHGVTRIDALNKPFDPNCHEAVMQQPAADKPAMTVLRVLEQGYMLHDRVLRPARVIVSVVPPAE